MVNKRLAILFQNFKRQYRSLKERRFVIFIVSSTISRAVSFLSVIFLSRILLKADYGMLIYADNLRNYILLFNGLGQSVAILRYCSRSEQAGETKGYFFCSLIIGLLFDALLITLSTGLFTVIPLDFENARGLLIGMAFLPVFVFIFECFQAYFRALLKNKAYSIVSIVFSACMIVFQVVLGIFYGVSGIVAGRYAAALPIILICLYYYRRFLSDKKVKIKWPTKETVRKMVWLGISLLAANAASSLMVYNETFILGMVTKSESLLADYRAGSLALQITYFVVSSINLFIFPYFSKKHTDRKWVWSRYIKLSKYVACIMIPIHIVLIFGAKLFISFIFGEQYVGSAPLMQILMVASLFQTIIRMPVSNILVAIGKEKMNLYINVASLIIHAVADFFMIRAFGIMGAGFTLTIIYLVSSVILLYLLKRSCMHPSINGVHEVPFIEPGKE